VCLGGVYNSSLLRVLDFLSPNSTLMLRIKNNSHEICSAYVDLEASPESFRDGSCLLFFESQKDSTVLLMNACIGIDQSKFGKDVNTRKSPLLANVLSRENE
jgi:hypothetical protein